MKKIKALHVTGFWSGNFYYRGYLPAMANGWLVSNEFIDDRNNGKGLVAKMAQVDVVQFQRPNHSQIVDLMSLTRRKGKVVVFDDDDTFKIGEGIVPLNEKEERFAKEVNANRNRALEVADAASCTTNFLAKELSEVADKVVVLPNCIDPADAGNVDANTTGKPRILILGSVVSNDDWKIARKAIEAIADKVTFVLLGAPSTDNNKMYKEDMKFWRSLPDIEEHPFVRFGGYYNKIQELACDVCIAPRADNYFNRCKSNLKFLEVSLFAIPFIGQAFEDGLSPYQVNPDDKNFMKLAMTEDDWVEVLQDFVDNVATYKEMGEKARGYVTEHYSIWKHAHKWEDFYNTL